MAADKQSGLVQGTLDMLILKTLALEPMHGYGIGVRLDQISKGVFQVNAGSLFPAFRRLERDIRISNSQRSRIRRLAAVAEAVAAAVAVTRRCPQSFPDNSVAALFLRRSRRKARLRTSRRNETSSF